MKQLDKKKTAFFKVNYKVVLCMLLCVSALPSFAATLTVNTTNDTHAVDPAVSATDGGGNISLRSAIEYFDTQGGTSSIILPAGTYTLELGEIFFGNVAEDISIIGADSSTTIIKMDKTSLLHKDRIFNIDFNLINGVSTTIRNVSFINGTLETDEFGGGAILAGGPSNSLTIKECNFAFNSIDTGGTNGGAIAFEGGGNLVIDSSSFVNNTCATGDAGAVWFDLPNNGNIGGTLSITNSLFKNNIINTAGVADGGALEISTEGGNSGAFSATVNHNTFIDNTASSGSHDAGGDISVDNGYGGTIPINFNRFVGANSDDDPSSMVVATAAGGVDATNNWWGNNDDPSSAGDFYAGGGGTIDLSDWIILSSKQTPVSLCTEAPVDTSVVITSFIETHGGAFLTTADISTLIGLPISFGSAIDGSLVGAPAVINPTGKDTVDFVANAAGSGSLHASIDNETLAPSIPITAVTLPTTTPPSTPVVVTQNVGDKDDEYFSTCQLLDSLGATGASPVSGSVTSEVWVESSVPHILGVPFVQRHYQIEPTTAPTTSTGTVTLYFLQTEFDEFNADPGATSQLPAFPSDATGKSNLRIAQYEGTSIDASGMPASYTGSASIINPNDANIVWDAANNRWAVTFDVTGFSGFIVQTTNSVVAVKFANLTATLTGDNTATLNWDALTQAGIKEYVIEKSTDGAVFSPIDSVTANGLSSYTYSYLDTKLQPGTDYYRVESIGDDGAVDISPTAKVSVQANQDISVYPDPVQDKFFIKQLGKGLIGTATLTDLSGSVLQTIQIISPLQQVNVGSYASGVYVLHFSDGSVYKIIKQ